MVRAAIVRRSVFSGSSVALAVGAWLALATGCGLPDEGAPTLPVVEPPAPAATAAPTAAASTDPAPAGPCSDGMALVAGGYCPAIEHRCLEWPLVQVGGDVEKMHCSRYAEPAVCLRKTREPMRFCMDRYEWPNRAGELPRVLVSWEQARASCASVGKRLCTEEEFNFACEGEAMRPHVTGFVRDGQKCNYDRPYRQRTFTFQPWEACMTDEPCKAAFEAIDQRLPAGSLAGCVNDQGIFDLDGNVNEWVMLPRNKGPHRSGIKGGWWGPVRNRCRPTVTFHDEGDYGYEVGFRCCSDAG